MAGGFHFRLEVVRGLRKQERDAQRRALAEAVQALRGAEERQGQLQTALIDTLQRTRGAQAAARLDVARVRVEQFYRSRLHRRLGQAEDETKRCRAGVDVQREKLAEATRRLKGIEKLRERRWMRYQLGQRKKEQALLDEAALALYARSGANIEDGGAAA